MLFKTSLPVLGFFLGLSLLAAQSFAATTLSFYGITANDTSGMAVTDGEASLMVEIIDIGSNQVRFTFTNDSDIGSLTDVYFDDGALLDISDVSSSTGVSFSGGGASPPNLPGASSVNPSFQTTARFLADSDSPVTKNGVQNNEWLSIDFHLKSGKTYDDVLAALLLPKNADWLRIGLHVQGYSCGSGTCSESFINSVPVSPVPEAQSHAMILAGLGMLALAARRRKLI